MMQTIEIITAITGGIDKPKAVPPQGMPFKRTIYRRPLHPEMNPRNQALYFKTQMHRVSEADIMVWIDGKIQVTSRFFLAQALDQLGDNDIGILKHAERDCIYTEVDYIERMIAEGNTYLATRYAHRPIRQQVENYRRLGYPSGAGLYDCSIIIRRRSSRLDEAMNAWWIDCQKDHFDQTAICWHLRAAGIKAVPLVFTAGTFKLVKHLKVC